MHKNTLNYVNIKHRKIYTIDQEISTLLSSYLEVKLHKDYLSLKAKKSFFVR